MCDPVRPQVQAQSKVTALIGSAHRQVLDVPPAEALRGQAGTGPLRKPKLRALPSQDPWEPWPLDARTWPSITLGHLHVHGLTICFANHYPPPVACTFHPCGV